MPLLFSALKSWALQMHVAKDNSILRDELPRLQKGYIADTLPNQSARTKTQSRCLGNALSYGNLNRREVFKATLLPAYIVS